MAAPGRFVSPGITARLPVAMMTIGYGFGSVHIRNSIGSFLNNDFEVFQPRFYLTGHESLLSERQFGGGDGGQGVRFEREA